MDSWRTTFPLKLAEMTAFTLPLPSNCSYPAMVNGPWSFPEITTPSWAKRYVPSSVALEHFALEAFSSPFSSPLSSAYPVPPARTPAPTTSSTSTTPAAHIPLRFIRVVLLWYEPFLTASKVPLHLLFSHVHGEALSYLNLTPLLGCTIAPPHLRRICWCSGSCAPPFPPATDMVMRPGGERNTPKQAHSSECVEKREILGSSRLQAGADLGSKAAAHSAHYPCPPGLRASSWDLWRGIVTSSGDWLRSNFPRISRKSGTYLSRAEDPHIPARVPY